MIIKRRKGVAIVETSKGILLVATERKRFMLPGGGAEKRETRKKAAIRELYEETNLKTKEIKYLFSSKGSIYNRTKGNLTRDHSKIFLISAEGTPKPKNEIKYIDFWKEGSKLKIKDETKYILEKYLKENKKEQI